MILLSNEIKTIKLVGNSLVIDYSKLVGQRTETIIKNVPKSNDSRIKLLLEIESKASRCPQNESNFEDYKSLVNRYERQWESLAILIYGWNKDFNKVNINYNYGDVLAS
jgi:hypothetical protein